MRRSGEVVVEEDSELPSLLEDEEDYDDEDTWEGFDDDTEAVYIDVDTGEAVDPAELDEYGLIDEGGGLPPAA